MQVLATLLAALPLTSIPQEVDAAPNIALELGREHCALFYDEDFETLWSHLSDELKKQLGGSVEALAAVHASLVGQIGDETKIVDETGQNLPSGFVYVRQVRYSKVSQTMDFVWQFDPQKTVIGFVIMPTKKEAESRFLEYRTKTKLRLPFEGKWDIFWGGRTLIQNYHTAYPDQRFAYDIMILKEGKSHAGDGTRNEDYFCFGKRILCPGDGVVVSSAKDVKDNVPGEMNPAQALGNHVIIDHGNGEFSFMAHFKQGTLRVKTGDKVKSGDQLGLAGNSGNTSEAHLHYHLQNTPTFNQGEGMPSHFLNYFADGEFVERGEPVKGQVVEAKEPVEEADGSD